MKIAPLSICVFIAGNLAWANIQFTSPLMAETIFCCSSALLENSACQTVIKDYSLSVSENLGIQFGFSSYHLGIN